MSKSKTLSAAVAAVLMSVAAASVATTPANAATVYCATAGVPQGCIVRATPAPVVVAPAARVAAASVTRVGYGYYGGPAAIHHVGYTRVTPYGVRHVGYTRVWR
ncbi:hypothetical protein [Bradyrhizobium sp. Tv2a-2]|uniref:hypothetical protein n=1 Tax=Bradyrhizobium sp. Tv2a-2 TaxID=113395 RepID=UPI0003FA41FB|nr:hypothetical protein [Bradyrhizobium sp. Tv2a-2]